MQERITGIDQIKKLFRSNNTKVSIKRKLLNVPAVLTHDFMRKYTNFWSVEEMEDEFKLLYGTELTNLVLETEIFNRFIQNNTIFEGWQDMLSKAGKMNMNRLVRKAIAI